MNSKLSSRCTILSLKYSQLLLYINSIRYLFRLYWFPLKILYTCGVVSAHRAYMRGAGLYAFFNSLLWLLLCLDIYWFYVSVLLYCGNFEFSSRPNLTESNLNSNSYPNLNQNEFGLGSNSGSVRFHTVVTKIRYFHSI